MKNKALLNSNSFLVLFFFTSFSIFSQTISTFAPKINNIPTSPEAALLGKFGDIPVGFYTGTANISVPLYNIKDAGIEIPIKVDYQSSGVRVADEATWVGLNWSLMPEGTIIQEVRGKSDQDDYINRISIQTGYTEFKNRFGSLQTGTYNTRYQQGTALNNCCFINENGQATNPSYDSLEVMSKLLEGYGQPDIYNYSFAGYSGKFYINSETQQIVLIDKKEDITFEKFNTTTWIARTIDGNVYYFSVLETANGGVYNEYSGFTFKLDHITLNNGKTISFLYTDEKYTDIKTVETRDILGMTMTAGQQQTQISNPISYHNKKTLTKITTSDVIINFNLEEREDIYSDINNTTKRLKSIDIISAVTAKKIKSFEFNYDYFPYNSTGKPSASGFNDTNYALHETTLGKRLKLNSVQEVGYDASNLPVRTKPSYKFEYDMSVTMPPKNSMAVDYWGYYNGENNDKLLPNLDYFDYKYDPRYTNQYGSFPLIFDYGYTGANRYTNNAYAGAYLLKKLIYPTGGYSEFEYEPNSFTNQFIPDKIKNDLALKPTILLNDGKGQPVNYHKDFKLSKATTISFNNTVTDGFTPFNNPNSPTYTWQNFSGSKISFYKTKQGVKTIIKEWKTDDVLNVEFTNNHGKTWREDLRVDYDSDPTVVYSVDVVSTLVHLPADTYWIAALKSDFRYYDDTGVDTSISNQGGLRIKSIKNYNNFGNIASNKLIKYYDGKLLNKFEPITATKAQIDKCDVMQMVNHTPVYTSDITYYNKLVISTDDFGVDGGTMIGYTKVEEIELDKNNANKGKNVYSYINVLNQTKKGLPYIPNLKNGSIENETTFDLAGNKLNEINYTYSYQAPSNIFFGAKIRNQSFGNTDACILTPNSVISYIPFETGLNYKYSFDTYPILSEFFLLTRKETKQYFGVNAVTSTEDYTYTTQGKIKTSTLTNSNNDQLTTTTYYANDYPENLAIESTMVTAKMTGIPLVTENRKNTDLLSRQSTQYAKDATTSNIILPKYIFAGKGSLAAISNSEKKVTYDKYDTKSNIQQYTLENGTSVTILWGYGNTLPIAKIENATYAQIATALGITTAVLDTYNETNLTAINGLRTNTAFANSPISTFTHIPLIGVSTITDAKGDKITYTYDEYGRLINVRDKDNNILSENKYQYKN